MVQITNAAFTDIPPLLRYADMFGDSQISGAAPATSANLTTTVPAQSAYVAGLRVDAPSISVTVAASQDTYLDLNQDGTYTVTGVANNAAAPALGVNRFRSYRLVSSATAITSVIDLRPVDPFADYIFGLTPVYVGPAAVDITAGAANIPGLGKVVHVPNRISLTGLSLTASTWYYLYLYLDANSQPAVEAVTTAPAAPYSGSARAKTGDTSRRYLGAIRVSATANTMFKFRATGAGAFVQYNYLENISAAPFVLLSGGTATAPTAISAAAIAPPTSRILLCEMFSVFGVGSNNYVYIGFGDLNGTLAAGNYNYILYPANSNYFQIELTTAQAFNYMQTVSTAGGYIYAMGFIDER